MHQKGALYESDFSTLAWDWVGSFFAEEIVGTLDGGFVIPFGDITAFKTGTNKWIASFIGTTTGSVAPTLSAPLGEAQGSSGAKGTVTSDTADGDIFGVVTQSATTPTHAQIVAGQDHLGADADATQVVLSSVTPPNELIFSFTLLPETSYFCHFTQLTTADVESTNQVSSASFSTTANQAPVIDTPIGNRTCTVGVPFLLDVSGGFSDPEGDPLRFTAVGLPDGLLISPSTGIISGTPTGV